MDKQSLASQSPDKINEVLTRGVQQVLPDKKGLADLMAKRKIKLYQGFDPTAASLHIGHFIGVRKLAEFQKLGHEVIFLIGDFTGMIGDPTDKSATRKRLTRKEVLENLKSYTKQVSRILDFKGPNAAKVMFNSKWLAKLNFEELIDIASNFTVQQMIERDMFQERLKYEKPIYLHEFFYPMMQGYDSVAMNVDLEVGGNDQLFNMMAGRSLMQAIKGKDKYVMTMKLLTDSSGKKMGKTEGNAVFLADSASEIFGKIMSWPDSLMNQCVESLTDLPLNFAKKRNPLEIKKTIAFEVAKQVHGEKDALDAQKEFEKTFQDRRPEFNIKITAESNLAKTIVPFTPRQSMSSAKELIKSRAVDVNRKTVTDGDFKVKLGDEIKVGSRTFLKVSK